MKAFDLEKALAGEPIVTRIGTEAKVDRVAIGQQFPLIVDFRPATNGDKNSEWVRGTYELNGRCLVNTDSDYDLGMKATTPRQGWLNIYPNSTGHHAHPTKERALDNALSNVVDTIKIEWEE